MLSIGALSKRLCALSHSCLSLYWPFCRLSSRVLAKAGFMRDTLVLEYCPMGTLSLYTSSSCGLPSWISLVLPLSLDWTGLDLLLAPWTGLDLFVVVGLSETGGNLPKLYFLWGLDFCP